MSVTSILTNKVVATVTVGNNLAADAASARRSECVCVTNSGWNSTFATVIDTDSQSIRTPALVILFDAPAGTGVHLFVSNAAFHNRNRFCGAD